jgi:YHS domain-containing protein
MDSKAVRYLFVLLLSALITVTLTGCSGYDTSDAESAAEDMAAEDMAAEAVEGAVDAAGEAAEGAMDMAGEQLNAAAVMVLAKADGMDGAEDMVVAKCPGCALAMEGNAEHAAQMGDYELHFCSEDCKNKFNESPVESLMAMQLPEVDPSKLLE